MENAQRAITIAGGVLIALMVVSLIVFVRGRLSSYENKKLETQENEKVAEFNKRLEAYDSVITGNKMISLVHLAEELNKQYGSQNGYSDIVIYARLQKQSNVEAKFYGMDGLMSKDPDYKEYTKPVKPYHNGNKYYNMNKYIEYATREDKLNALDESNTSNGNIFKSFTANFRKQYFKCTDVSYDSTHSMIYEMYFDQVIEYKQ